MILPWLILVPILGGLLSWIGARAGRGVNGNNASRWIALATMATVTGLALNLWLTGDYTLAAGINTGAGASDAPRWGAEFRAPWIASLGISIHLGLDGLSLLMVLLTGVMGMAAVAASWREVQDNVGAFHLNLLWMLAGVVGVFLALDLFLFFVFWEVMLIPMYFLIVLWGHDPEAGADSATINGTCRFRAATKFLIYTQASGLLMLVSILGLVFFHYSSTNVFSFDYDVLLGTVLPPEIGFMLMLGFFLAFAVKLPVVPLHGWLADAHAHAPTAASVDITGLLLKTAAYGLLRFALPLFPEASLSFAPVAIWLGIISIVYGALLAFAQTDIKRFIAYTSVSHMGFILIGIYAATHVGTDAGNPLALQGVVVLMLAAALSSGALFILAGQLFERLHTFDLREMGGLWSRLAILPAFGMFFAVATLGLPGLGNFVGEFLVLLGTFQVFPVAAIVATASLVLGAVYALALVHRAFLGPTKSAALLPAPSAREFSLLLTLAALLLALGIYPQPVLDTSAASMHGVQQIYLPVTMPPDDVGARVGSP